MGLEGIGVKIDDKTKTWTVAAAALPEPPAPATAGKPELGLQQAGGKAAGDDSGARCSTPIKLSGLTDSPDKTISGVRCSMCGASFGSRNLVFKHLRDAATSCGLTMAAAEIAAREPREPAEPAAGRAAAGATAARLILGPLVLAKWVGGLMLVAKTAVGYAHAQKQLRDSQVRDSIILSSI